MSYESSQDQKTLPTNPEELINIIVKEGSISSPEKSYSFLCPEINEGMYILKSMDLADPKDDTFIFLDDLKCADEFLNKKDLIMQDTIDYFNVDHWHHLILEDNERDGKKIILWSRIVKEKVGQCVEMAIMSQIQFQKKQATSFLCGGRSNQETYGTHAWNLIKRDDQIYIWDCGLKFYAPLDKLEVKKHTLYLYPDYAKSMGNKEKIIYWIGEEEK